MKLFENVKNKVTQSVGKTGLKLQKHSPELLVVGGVGCMISGGILACRSTLKLEDAIEDVKRDIEAIKTSHDSTDYYDNELDYGKDLAQQYYIFGREIVKLYWPTICLTTLGVAMIFGGHNISRKRNIALAAAYTGLEKSYSMFKERVAEEFGEETAFRLRNGLEIKDIKVEEEDEEGNTKEKEIKKAKVADPNKLGNNVRIFGEGNPNWEKDPYLTMGFLRGQQSYFNDMLKAKGYVFLSDVYKALGFEETPASRVEGWLLGYGDDVVDFGIFDVHSQANIDFVNGYEQAVLLDFNTDGVIFDKI